MAKLSTGWSTSAISNTRRADRRRGGAFKKAHRTDENHGESVSERIIAGALIEG